MLSARHARRDRATQHAEQQRDTLAAIEPDQRPHVVGERPCDDAHLAAERERRGLGSNDTVRIGAHLQRLHERPGQPRRLAVLADQAPHAERAVDGAPPLGVGVQAHEDVAREQRSHHGLEASGVAAGLAIAGQPGLEALPRQVLQRARLLIGPHTRNVPVHRDRPRHPFLPACSRREHRNPARRLVKHGGGRR